MFHSARALAFAVTLISTLSAVLSVAFAAAGAEPPRWTPADMLKVKGVSQVEVSPDGARVAFTVATAVMTDQVSVWRSHIHVAGADGKDSFQLTRGEQSATSPAWSPDGQWIAFLSSRPLPSGAVGLAKSTSAAAPADKKEGEPPANLWRIRVSGGEAEPLTDVKSSITAFRFSPDGGRLACLMTDPKTPVEEANAKARRDARLVEREFKRSRLYTLACESNAEGKRELRLWTPGDLHIPASERSFDWSPDGAAIVFAHQPTPRVDDWRLQDVSLVELSAGKVTPVAATKAAESQPTFSPDGKVIAFTVSDDEVRWAGAQRIRLARPSGEVVTTLAETHDSKPTIVGFTADSQRVLVAETYRTVGRLSALPVDGTFPVDLSPADQMVSAPSLNARRTHVGFVSEASDRPPEAFTSSLPAFQARQASRVQQLPEIPLGKTEVVTWRSFDERQIEGLLTLPPGYDGKQRIPLLLLIHGGPAGVFTQGCIVSRSPYPVAAFASRGWAVLRPNPRGSSGYGRDFRYANQKDWGGGDFRDNMAGVDAMIARGVADSQRLGVMGWSYGGYMTSWTITQTNRFKAASVGAAVTNLVSFTGTADIHGFLPDYFGGEFWEQGDLWRARSPVLSAHKVTTPSLIQHGEADLRVPVSQGYEFYRALERNKTPVEMAVYPRQPHGLQEPALQQDAMQRNLDWFAKWLDK